MSVLKRGAGALLASLLLAALPFTAEAAESTAPVPGPPAASAGVTAATEGVSLTGDRAGSPATARPAQRTPAKQSAGVARANWYYHITASCRGYENAIAAGADYWGGGVQTASGGTPVSCTNGYVAGCGISNAVGCNWNHGGRIALSTMVRDFALLSAHEFGHNWYDHSAVGCASWNSAYDVMKTQMC
ncbi:hypothetical protein [Streptomyces anthocyanicus]|uniref:hypothetical protein n=1 Tax=Streptomyces anthocyanicus TaxID=68174 RepID=UPI0017852E9E|nr:hypothetical protein [Streptomyces anthocyanicus]GHA21194.1 hypothetical protein GCM10010391_00390 [Streptomyces anthocyanicus]